MRLAVFQLCWKTAASFAFGKTRAYFPECRWNLSDAVTVAEVGPYPTFSPLPDHLKCQLFAKNVIISILSGRAVYFLWRCLSPAPGNPETEARELPGIMPYGARTFLPTTKLIQFSGRTAAWFIA